MSLRPTAPGATTAVKSSVRTTTFVPLLIDGSEATFEVAKCGHEYMVPTWAAGQWRLRARCNWCSTGIECDAWDALVAKRQAEHLATVVELKPSLPWHRARPTLVPREPSPESRICPTCDSAHDRPRAIHCSDRCARLSQYPPRLCALPSCGQTFRSADGNRRCCTARHNRKLYRIEHPNPPESLEIRRERWQRRRALKRGATTGRPVRLLEIAERDEWTCQLCGTPVDPALAWPDPLSKSLDHAVPLARGGAHDPSNVQLAHLDCNVSKGARLS